MFVCKYIVLISSINMANILILEANIFLLPLLLSDAILIAILATLSSYVFWNSTTKKCLIFAGQIIGISFFVTLLFSCSIVCKFLRTLLIPFWISACSFLCVLYSYTVIKKIGKRNERS